MVNQSLFEIFISSAMNFGGPGIHCSVRDLINKEQNLYSNSNKSHLAIRMDKTRFYFHYVHAPGSFVYLGNLCVFNGR